MFKNEMYLYNYNLFVEPLTKDKKNLKKIGKFGAQSTYP